VSKLERRIIESRHGQKMLHKTKGVVLPGFEGVPLYAILRFLRKEIQFIPLRERAAAIAYNFIMSVPPTCLFLFTLIPNLPFVSKRTIRKQLHDLIRDIIPAKAYNSGLINFVDSFLNGSKIGIISFGFLLSLFFASNAMMGVMNTFNRNYPGFGTIRGLHKRWVALKLTTLLFSLLVICLLLLGTQKSLLTYIGIENATIKEIILYAKWVIIIALIFYSFAFIYRYAPSTHKRWGLISPGAVIATILSLIATIGFSLFVNAFGRYNVLYGSIGTIMVVMILIFINSFIVLVGFEFNRSIKTLRAIAEAEAMKEIKQENKLAD
jgi:membrane protein